MIYCPKCGSVIPDNIKASFCGECGSNLDLDERPHVDSLDSTLNTPKASNIANPSPPKPIIKPKPIPPKPIIEPRFNPAPDFAKKNSEISLDVITRRLANDLISDFIKLKLIQENRFRILGLECLKCGSHSSLGLIQHYETAANRSKYSTSFKTRSIRVPICVLKSFLVQQYIIEMKKLWGC